MQKFFFSLLPTAIFTHPHVRLLNIKSSIIEFFVSDKKICSGKCASACGILILCCFNNLIFSIPELKKNIFSVSRLLLRRQHPQTNTSKKKKKVRDFSHVGAKYYSFAKNVCFSGTGCAAVFCWMFDFIVRMRKCHQLWHVELGVCLRF